MRTAISTAIQQALDLVESGASEDWQEDALKCVKLVCTRQRTFVADDVWQLMNRLYPETTTRDLRAMGPIMLRAVRLGWCERTNEMRRSEGEYRPGNRGTCHAHLRPVWRSKIYAAGLG